MASRSRQVFPQAMPRGGKRYRHGMLLQPHALEGSRTTVPATGRLKPEGREARKTAAKHCREETDSREPPACRFPARKAIGVTRPVMADLKERFSMEYHIGLAMLSRWR